MTGEQFRRIREKQLELTQGELADALAVHRNTIIRWESDKEPILKVTELAMAHLIQLARDRRAGQTVRR